MNNTCIQYSYLNETYNQHNLINKKTIINKNIKDISENTGNKIGNKISFGRKIINFFKSLCCCCKKDELNTKEINTKEINLCDMIQPYIGQFIDGVWCGVRTKDFYKDYDFIPKNDDEKIIYIVNKNNLENNLSVNKKDDDVPNRSSVLPLKNEELLDYNKIRDNSDKEVRLKYNINSIEDAAKMFTQYMNNKDNYAFIAYIFEMDNKGFKIVKKINKINDYESNNLMDLK